MRQKNAVKSIRAMMRFGVTAAALGTLLLAAPAGAQTPPGGRVTATSDQTGRLGTGATPGTPDANNVQPVAVQPATGMMTQTGSRGMMGSAFYSGGRGFPWGLLGLIGLLGLWPRSRVRERTPVDRTGL